MFGKESFAMSEPVWNKASYEELYDLPENMIGEIIDGEIIATPRPSRRHINAAASLGGELIPTYRFGRGGPGGWIIYHEPEVHFGNDVLVPDLAGWRKERLSTPPAEHRFSIAPDWVCEILSPATVRIDRIKKMGIYALHAVPHLWLIDPAVQTLDVFRLESGKWLLIHTFAEKDKVRAEPFQEIEIGLGDLWLDEISAQ
jgi:Uma2 family endonuclease